MHHAAINVRDFEKSMTFWCDGIGLEQIMNTTFSGDWRTLFNADSGVIHSAFLGDPKRADAGVVELVEFPEAPPLADRPSPPVPTNGFFLLSLNTDVDATLARLKDLGLGGDPVEIEVSGVRMAVVHDPDGVKVELLHIGEMPDMSGLKAPSND